MLVDSGESTLTANRLFIKGWLFCAAFEMLPSWVDSSFSYRKLRTPFLFSLIMWLQTLKTSAQRLWWWLRNVPEVTPLAVVLSCAILLVQVANGYHDKFEKWEASWETTLKPIWLAWYEALHPYLGLAVLLGAGVLFLHALRVWPRVGALFRPVLIYGGLVFVFFLAKELRNHWWSESYGNMGEPPTPFFFFLKQVLMAALLLSPAFILRWFDRQPMLQKYTITAFIHPLVFCYAAFGSLWIVMDLMDKLKDFQEAKVDSDTILQLYLNLLPAVYVMVTPAALLLASLYALTKLSRANEIVSMLTSGLSLGQILKPVIILTAYLSLLGMAMNYHWAPNADGEREAIMRGVSSKGKSASLATNVMFRNEETGRTWFFGAVPFDLLSRRVQRVMVYQMDGKDRIKTVWRGAAAKWWAPNGDATTGMWSFYDGTERTYKSGVAVEERYFDGSVQGAKRVDIVGWSETPWSILSGSILPDSLGVPQLVAFALANEDMPKEKLAPFRTHLHHRFAYPWQGLVIVLLAAPLGVSFSRRGALGGIAAAVIIFFALMFVNEFFMSMGKGGHMAPWLAAWMPNLIFGSVGFILFYAKVQNKELPKFAPKQWWLTLHSWWQSRQTQRAPAL